MEILKTKGLSKCYVNGSENLMALSSTDLSIEKGEFVAIVGPSGSGKSTLLHLLGGLDKPSEGKVFINGQDISEMSESKLAEFRRKNIGFIFQAYNLVAVLTAEENIYLPMTFEGERLDKKYIDEIVDFLGLSKRINHFPSELSGGQQQRVAIARALATQPALILADEPTGNLDTKTTEEVMTLLQKSVKKYNQTLVMITHNPNIANKADRIIEVEDGRIISDERRK